MVVLGIMVEVAVAMEEPGGWMDGWMDGWRLGWMVVLGIGWMDGWMAAGVDGGAWDHGGGGRGYGRTWCRL